MQTDLTNEIGRAAILLPPDATIYSGSHYLAVAFDAVAGGEPVPVILGSSPLPFNALWELMSLLCGDRAQRAVDHCLVVDGRAITPEAYLKLWRAACSSPLTPDAFVARYSAIPTFVLEGSLQLVRGCMGAWESSAFATFRDFEEAYANDIEVSEDQQRFVVSLDARRPHAARDAFYAASFLTRYGRPKGLREVGTARTELRRIEGTRRVTQSRPRPAQLQPDLFAFMEA